MPFSAFFRDVADGLNLGAVVGDRVRYVALRLRHDGVQLLRDFTQRRPRGIGDQIGRIQFPAGGGIESLVARYQNIDRSLQLGQSALRITEPDGKVPRRGRHAVLRHITVGALCHRSRIVGGHVLRREVSHDFSTPKFRVMGKPRTNDWSILILSNGKLTNAFSVPRM
jgi:hypothetical protein